jgi:hypothetical protein
VLEEKTHGHDYIPHKGTAMSETGHKVDPEIGVDGAREQRRRSVHEEVESAPLIAAVLWFEEGQLGLQALEFMIRFRAGWPVVNKSELRYDWAFTFPTGIRTLATVRFCFIAFDPSDPARDHP